MSILERVTRVIEKHNLLPRLVQLLSYISILLAFIGTGWIFVLPIDGQYRNTYISENALMPSQLYSFYRESEWNFLRGYRDEIIRLKELPLDLRNEEVQSWFQDLGYKSFKHHFVGEEGQLGENLYSILYTPQADSESILISAPWITSTDELNVGGVALALSLGKYFSRLNIWSKNIIIVIPQDSKYASRSWVELYHRELDSTAGSIESAFILEFPRDSEGLHHIELEYDGLNGQLPNLDLVNCAVFISEHEGFKVLLHKTVQYSNSYWDRLKILLLGIKDLAVTGIGSSNGCETFSGWNIQAITLRAIGDGPIDITTYGRVVEGLFRSVNNLLEKFHQSFFYYLMLQPRNFVSIGTYLPSAVLLSVSFGFAALNSFLNNGYLYQDLIGQLKSTAFVFGIVLALSTGVGITLQTYRRDLVTAVSATVIVQGNILLSLLPLVNLNGVFGLRDTKLKYVLQSWSYLYMTMVIVSLLVVHYTLAFIIGVVSIPLLLTKIEYLRDCRFAKWRPWANSAALLVSNPFTALVLLSKVDNITQLQLLSNVLSSWDQLQCWTWFIFIIGWYPVWLCVMISCI